MIRAIILSVIILCSLNSNASWFGWSEETPYGNHIKDESGKSLHMRNGVKVNCINEWYFYNDCVIGKMDTAYKCHTYKYFVANEMFNTVDTFYLEQDWMAFIELHHLQPLVWKRIYCGSWSVITWELFGIIISFTNNLKPSANGCIKPKVPTTFGPFLL